MPNTISKINGYSLKDNVSGYTTNTGTVTGVTAGTGLSGGTISTSGTISLDTTRALTASDIATGTDTTNKLVSAKTIADVLRTAGSVTDVQIGGTSILSSGVANIVTNTAYNSSTNKIATMSDISDTKVKMTSTASSYEYPIILGPTSITSGNDYEAYYNSSVTINANSQQITSKGVKIYYDANSNFTISQSGYQGNSTNNTPRVKFESLKANSSSSIDRNVILTGVTTPTGTSSSYDNYAASKKYVDDRVGVIIRTWS